MIEEEITLDLHRAGRLGFDEAIFCEAKRVEQIQAIIDAAGQDSRSLLLTRLTEDQFQALTTCGDDQLDYDPVSRTGFYAWNSPETTLSGVAVVTAGSSDVPVAREAIRTLTYYGVAAEHVFDVGVAGLWRLMRNVDTLRGFSVVIVVAGMDGALPSVVAGLLPGLVIAVPTSVGYGAARNGETALHAALASCAPGLLVTNIDNGYGAACAALRAIGLTRSRLPAS